MKRLISRLGDFLFGGPAPSPQRPAPKPLPEILFTPVIFANGRDDDADGFKAFLENRPVILRGTLIPPDVKGGKACTLRGLNLRFSCGSIELVAGGDVVQRIGFSGGRNLVVFVDPDIPRCVVGGCYRFNAEVEP